MGLAIEDAIVVRLLVIYCIFSYYDVMSVFTLSRGKRVSNMVSTVTYHPRFWFYSSRICLYGTLPIETTVVIAFD